MCCTTDQEREGGRQQEGKGHRRHNQQRQGCRGGQIMEDGDGPMFGEREQQKKFY